MRVEIDKDTAAALALISEAQRNRRGQKTPVSKLVNAYLKRIKEVMAAKQELKARKYDNDKQDREAAN